MSEIAEKMKVESLEAFMQQLRFRMNIIENTLQTEESGNKIAFLQGECAGFRSLCTAIAEAGYVNYKDDKRAPENTIFSFDDKTRKWGVTSSKYSVLIDWETTALDVEEVMSEAKKPLESRINKMKDRLFYEAEKGRDLHFVKGWFCILSCFDDWCAKIHEAFSIAKKEKEHSLDFGDDEEPIDPFDIG